ncbi:hypothetical protein J5N97_020808 [Dioscorea zingiberensis]|uniref:Uncharacterized protein n=1 Tax=Dioscorea zingiberensis TaxID=325984 RepID=A0A9D5CH35_9LILI|nr:hypothetical protein J5N97_020808 [Dioscorea zingiberensis]
MIVTRRTMGDMDPMAAGIGQRRMGLDRVIAVLMGRSIISDPATSIWVLVMVPENNKKVAEFKLISN